MSDPYLPELPFLYYFCDDRNPTSDEPLLYHSYPDLLYIWKNKSTQDIFWCKNNAADGMVWHKMIDNNNLASSLPQDLSITASPVFMSAQLHGLDAALPVATDAFKNLVSLSASAFKTLLGLTINTNRCPARITPSAFNIARRPSAAHDVFVSANISFPALAFNTQVNIQTSTDNFTWVDNGKVQQKFNLGGRVMQQLYGLVPAGSYYRFTQTGSRVSIDSILETQL